MRMRIKTMDEFVRDFGQNFRERVLYSFAIEMSHLFGYLLLEDDISIYYDSDDNYHVQALDQTDVND